MYIQSNEIESLQYSRIYVTEQRLTNAEIPTNLYSLLFHHNASSLYPIILRDLNNSIIILKNI